MEAVAEKEAMKSSVRMQKGVEVRVKVLRKLSPSSQAIRTMLPDCRKPGPDCRY